MANKGMKTKEVVKKYTFSTEEKDTLEDIEIGLMSFKAALNGMLMHKQMLLREAYKRNGISDEAPKGFVRKVQYSLMQNEIIVTDMPAEKETKAEKN